MTGSPPELRSFLEAEMFFGVKKRERIAYAVAGGGLAIGLMGMIAVVTLLIGAVFSIAYIKILKPEVD